MSEVEQMPLEIWTDINGNATRTQFKGGVKYIRADERDRLRADLEEVKRFIYAVTLHLQSNRSQTPEQHDAMFQRAYQLYVKHDVDGTQARNARAALTKGRA